MRAVAILVMVAALASGCAFEAGESEPARDAEPTADERSAFDASLFKFFPFVLDDHQGESGGAQRASAVLGFVDTRASYVFPDRWSCRVTVDLPIRLRYSVITPDRAAELTAVVADAAGSAVLHSQPRWQITGLFCKRFAEAMVEIFKRAPGGPFGARVTSP